MKILDIGCGRKKYKGAIGLDKFLLKEIDIIHDLENPFMPFKNNSFDTIIASHVLEHIHDLIPLMEEIYRILKPNGIIKIIVPYWLQRLMWRDPTHIRAPCFFMFDYLTRYYETRYISKAMFKIVKRKFQFNKFLKPLEFIVNIFPEVYEGTFFKFVLPAGSIYFELKAIKDKKLVK